MRPKWVNRHLHRKPQLLAFKNSKEENYYEYLFNKQRGCI